MKVMWLCNSPIPYVAQALNIPGTPREGWLVSVFNAISTRPDVDFIYTFTTNSLNPGLNSVSDNGNTYIAVNDEGKGIPKMKALFIEAIDKCKPDLIHIWGTEGLHSYAMVEAAKETGVVDKVVVSIQGLVSVYEKHYYAGIPGDVQMIPTFRDVIRKDTIKSQKKTFEAKGKYEIETIKTVKHVIGRTFWDRACVELINPSVEYHFNNETLRSGFYSHQWKKENCIPHSVFVTQAQYPIKGFHYLLEAVSILKESYPNVTVNVSGNDNSFKSGMLVTAYGRYIQKLIRKFGLENNVHYIGMLNEEQMVEQFLKSEVFVSPSVIENSPNSVGEAMLLGMPVVSSNVGGVVDLLEHKKEGFLYQSDAPYLLAYYISKFFSDDKLEAELGTNARSHALVTHDKEHNVTTLVEIYNKIFQEQMP